MFNIGDKVICITNKFEFIKLNKTYTVSKVDFGSKSILLYEVCEYRNLIIYYNIDNFKLEIKQMRKNKLEKIFKENDV